LGRAAEGGGVGRQGSRCRATWEFRDTYPADG
jgi:hypothetical protein